MCHLLFILRCFLSEGPKTPQCTIQLELHTHLSNPPHIPLAALPLFPPLFLLNLLLNSCPPSSHLLSYPTPPPFLKSLSFTIFLLPLLIHKAAYLAQPLSPISLSSPLMCDSRSHVGMIKSQLEHLCQKTMYTMQCAWMQILNYLTAPSVSRSCII